MVQKRSKAELDALRAEFRAQADDDFDQMFGHDGRNGLVSFAEREDQVCRQTDRLAPPPTKARNDDAHHIVSLTLAYVKTNADRMDYSPIVVGALYKRGQDRIITGSELGLGSGVWII